MALRVAPRLRRPTLTRQAWLDGLATALAALVVGLPALVTYNGFMYDYTNHLWLVWVQSHAISATGVPTYFLHTSPPGGGIFEPFFVFYGGTLYALTGAVSAALGGSVRIAYVGVILASTATAYGAAVWLARQLGARSWPAHAPAVTFVASAYYVTNLYGRGAWPEFVAVSAIPLLVAAGTWIARAPRLKALPCALFVGAGVIWSGSHNITLAWGGVLIVAMLVALRLIVGRSLVRSRGRLVLLLWLLALAVCVNAWFLLPNALNAADTQIASRGTFDWEVARDFNTPLSIFHPLRYIETTTDAHALYAEIPVWLLAWALAVLAVARGHLRPQLRGGAAACAIVLGGLLALRMIEPLWSIVPGPLRLIQFPYRLETYVDLIVAGLVLVAILAFGDLAPGRRRRLLAGCLAGAMTVSAGLCVWQLWTSDTHVKRSYLDLRGALVSDDVPPRTWYNANAYFDAAAPEVAFDRRRILVVDPTRVRGNDETLVLDAPKGRAPFAINVGAGAGLVDIEGLERVGRSEEGFAIVRRPAGSTGPVRVTIGLARGGPVAGLIVSLLAIAGLAATAAAAALRRRRRRTR